MQKTDNIQIDFFKIRDLGEVLQVTFLFIRLCFKPLIVGVSFIVLPFFLIGTIFTLSAMDGIFTPNFSQLGNQLASMVSLMLGLLFLGLGGIMLITYVNELLRMVSQHPYHKIPTVQEVWHATRKYFWWNLLHVVIWFIFLWMYLIFVYIVFLLLFLGGMLGVFAGSVFIAALMGILAFAAFLFFILYFLAAATPIFFIATYEKVNIFTALNRSFSLLHATKTNFWTAIFTNLLSYFIQFIISGNILLPILVIQGIIEYNSDEEIKSNLLEIFFKSIYALFYLISPFLYIIPLMANGFNYFNLRERAEGIGLKQRIAQIGKQNDFSIEMYESE
ncbi:MAG: hypothetical protein N2167_01060 [Flavobacteriales bacterium]|nr:hypothetical protein [Flavobacteriales bacterium]